MQIDVLDYCPQEIAQGFAKKDETWVCLLCGEEFEDGIVYGFDGKLYEAHRAVSEHIKAEHGSVFLHLMHTQNKYTGLTQHQTDILRLMYAGSSDKAIAEQTTGSANTASIRNLRFQLKEREKQAKAFLALMEAYRLEHTGKEASAATKKVSAPVGATLTDERFEITEKERFAVLKTYFNVDGSLKEFPVREKRKIIALHEIAGRFEKGRAYIEKEVNTLIAYPDFATIRRYLIEYGFLERSVDCSQYWVKEKNDAT